jgi:hypothetical protein|tara:strand:+ start:28 stop:441 length:414 start_codon:yes stop_codon:yes gene_type:complete
MQENLNELVKAELTHLDSLETLTVDWNPNKYSVSKHRELVAAGAPGGTGSSCEGQFSTRLFLDSTRRAPRERNLREIAQKLEGWMDPDSPGGLPPKIVFLWGPFRFTGYIERLDEEWVRFDPDGTPVRGFIRLQMRG